MNKCNNKGVAMFISLTLLLLLSLCAIAFLLTSYNSMNVNEAIARKRRAIVAAEAGISYAYWKIRINQDDDGNPMSDWFPDTCTLRPPISLPPGWDMQVDIEDTGAGRKKISSTVTYPKASVF